MARMAFAASPEVAPGTASAFDCHLALVPKEDTQYGTWSIEEEPMGESWHDSSWMLRKGLDVIENFELDPVHEGWTHTWRAPADIEPAFLSLRLVDLG